MKKIIIFIVFLYLIGIGVTSCTPLIVGGAAVGGAYAGYKLGREGYVIKITKPVKGKKVDNSTKPKK